MVGIEIQEVTLPADGTHITTQLQLMIKKTKIELMKTLHPKSGNPRETNQAPKIRRTKIWWQNNI